MDLVWNESVGEQLRSASERAMQGQVSDIRDAAASLERQAAQREAEANRIASLPPIIIRKTITEEYTDGDGSSRSTTTTNA